MLNIANHSNLPFLYASIIPLESVFAVEDNKSDTNNKNNISIAKVIDQLVEKARQLYYKGDYQGALKLSDELLAIDGDNPDAMNIKGVAFYDLGIPEEAWCGLIRL